MYNESDMALIYFYDATELDKAHISQALRTTDHHWEYVAETIAIDTLNPDTEVISIFVTSFVTREMIEKLPRLKLIACRSTGFNNVDMEAAQERNITVVNVPTYGESTVAEYAFTLLLSLVRKIPEVLKPGSQVIDQKKLMGHDLRGKTFGVIGTGHIGQHALSIGKGFGMKTIGFDAFPQQHLEQELGFSYCSLEELLQQADIVSLHVPYLPSTHHVLNAERLGLMKPGAVVINTARGELVDTGALIEKLSDGSLGGAALDVVEGEALLNYHEEITLLRSQELPEDMLRHSVEISLLKKMPNVIISPHNAFNTYEAIERINQTTAKNIIDFWYGETPNAVKPQKKPVGKLIVARHAESEWNATGQWTGTRDIHLSEKGFRESGQLGRLLKKLSLHIDIAYCSEQIRTRETLEGVLDAAQQFTVDIVRNKALNERDYGDYTGKNKWEMKELIGEEAWNNVRRGWDAHIPNGETLKTVYERVVPFYEETILPLLMQGKNVLIVAHGNSIRALMKHLESISDEHVGELEMLFGSIVVYDLNDDGSLKEKSVSVIDSPPPNA